MGDTDTPFLSTVTAAGFLRLSPRTLERLRVEGRGPSYRKHAKRVFYTREDLVAWSESQRRQSTREHAA